MQYREFSDIANGFGYVPRRCTAIHWQASGHGVTVNVWPMGDGRLKYLKQDAGAGVKARVGDIGDALAPIHKAANAATCGNGHASSHKPVAMPPRCRATIQMDENGAFTVISHGDAVEELAFDEMLGVVVSLFHTPKQKPRAERLFASEKSFRRQHIRNTVV